MFDAVPKLHDRDPELKLNDVRFVANSISMQSTIGKEKQQNSSDSIIIVFALYVRAIFFVWFSFYELSMRLGRTFWSNENQFGFRTDEMKLAVKTDDEEGENIEKRRSMQGFTSFDRILEQLSKTLRQKKKF